MNSPSLAFRFPVGLRPSAFGLACLSAVLLLAAPGESLAKTDAAAAKAQVVRLTAVLKSNAPEKEKADACRELARVGTKEAVPALAALLGDEKLSHMARYGLETIPHSSVDAAFRAALDKLQGRPLVGVIGSIGVRRDAGAVKALAKKLHDPDTEVAQAAARALGSIGNSAAAAELHKAFPDIAATNQLAVCEGLLRCAESLAGKGSTKKAVAIYDQLRAQPLPPQVRLAAWRGAILNRGNKALPLLVVALDSDDFALSVAGIRISRELPGTEVTLELAKRLPKFRQEDQQVLLAQTLGRRGDAAALPALFAAASKGQSAVRLAAIRALPDIGHPAAVPVFLELMGDADLEIAAAAKEALGSLPGREANAAVMNLLARGTISRRIAGMDLVVRRRMTFALPQIFTAAEDLEPKLRVAALKTLGELAGPEEIPAVLRLFEKAKKPEDIEAAEQALVALSLKAQNPEAVTTKLSAQMAHLRPAQQCALLRVLTAVGGTTALKAVRAAVDSHEPEVHIAAIRALSSWTSAEAGADLLELARVGGGSTDQMLCLRGYLRLAGSAEVPADKRLAMCREASRLVGNVDEKNLLLAALGAIHSLPSLELIQTYLEDAGSKEEAAAATTDVSEKLLEGADADQLAPKLIPALEKVEPATSNATVAKRARTLLEKAHSKAGAHASP
jgi:HEAT repeat protein